MEVIYFFKEWCVLKNLYRNRQSIVYVIKYCCSGFMFIVYCFSPFSFYKVHAIILPSFFFLFQFSVSLCFVRVVVVVVVVVTATVGILSY